MSNLLVAGLAAVFLVTGAGGSADAANPNVPQSSPYALLDADSSPWQGPTPLVEGRAAYVHGDLSEAPSHRRMAAHGGDIVVHTSRSYLDPGTSAEVATEDRYFYDTAHYSLNSEGPDFTRNQGGFENLPGPLGPN
jgi:hypothetical protein